MSSAFGLAKIGQIAIPVTDIDRAVAFYRDVLGMKFLFQAPPGLGFFDCGGVRLMLDLPAREQAGRGGVIYYQVPDLQAGIDRTIRTGGRANDGRKVLAQREERAPRVRGLRTGA